MTTRHELILLTLLIAFIALKLAGQITWSWWWASAPLWLPALVALLIGAVQGFVVGAIAGFKSRK